MKIVYTSQFKKDYKLAQKQGKNLAVLKYVIAKLADGEKLDFKYHDHRLSGSLKGYRELHIRPDWLLIYQIKEDEILLFRMGSRSELFK